MKRQFFYMLIAGILTVSVSASGGQVLLKNGDRLTGTITTMTDGKLTIETELAGKVEIAMKNVQTISSDEPLELQLKDENLTKQQELIILILNCFQKIF